MSQFDPSRVAAILAELDRICADARKVRQEIAELTSQRRAWPEHRHHSPHVSQPTQSPDLAVLGDRPRNN
jgi:hypothetical protein